MIARAPWMRAVSAVAICAFTFGASAQGILIPGTTRRDHVFDSSGSTLYFTTADGALQRFSVGSGSLLDPVPVGVSLSGIDLTPDGTTAYITDRTTSATQGFVRRLDLGTGNVSTITYGLGFQESFSWDVVMVSNTRGFFTTNIEGSGWTWLRQINTANNTSSPRTELGQMPERARLHRGANRSRMVLTQVGISSGPVWNYNTAANVFTLGLNTDWFLNGSPGAVSRNGQYFSLGLDQTRIYNLQYGLVTTLPSSGGSIFDSVRDLLYLVNPATDEIVVYRTIDWSIQSTIPIGENVSGFEYFDDGMMSISDNGQRLALSTPSGIRIFAIPAPGVAGMFAIAGVVLVARRRR